MFSLCVLSGTLAVWLIGDSNLAVEKLRNIMCLFLCVPYPLFYVSWSRLQLPGDPKLDKCDQLFRMKTFCEKNPKMEKVYE